jgi:F-type H+-transporting ATPase subunit b
MRIDWWTLGLQTVNILVLVWILSRFLFRPVAAIIAKRRDEAGSVMAEAKAARDQAAAERDKAVAETARQAAARADVLAKAVAEAETQRAALLATAKADADHLRSAAEAEIAAAGRRGEEAAAARASLLAVDIAGKLFARLPDEARVSGFIAGLAEAVAALPASARAEIGDGAPVPLRAARELREDEAEACRAALAKALGREVQLSVVAEPGLIAGLEIDTLHAAVRNSFRADLARISAKLAQAGADKAP